MKKSLLKKEIGLVFFGIIFALNTFAQTKNAKDIVPAGYYNELMSKGKVELCRDDGSSGFRLLPTSQYSGKVRSSVIPKEKGNYPFTYEALYYISKADILKASNSSKSSITISDVSRVCRSVSKMKGMTYYSNTRKKHMVLYDRAYMFAASDVNVKNPSPIPDQNTGNANGKVYYALQDDASFGANKYKLNYWQNNNEFYTKFTLLDKMGKGPFVALYPGKLNIHITVTDCGDSLLLYFCTDLDSKNIIGIKRK